MKKWKNEDANQEEMVWHNSDTKSTGEIHRIDSDSNGSAIKC